MSKYCVTYVGGQPPATPEEGQKHFSKYMDWLASLGEKVISPANPFNNTHTIKPDGSVVKQGITSSSGFTIIEADSMEEALVMVKNCPFLEIGGSIEISEIMSMPGPSS